MTNITFIYPRLGLRKRTGLAPVREPIVVPNKFYEKVAGGNSDPSEIRNLVAPAARVQRFLR